MKKNNSHIALGAHYKHLKWTFIPNGSSIFILMQQEKRNSGGFNMQMHRPQS